MMAAEPQTVADLVPSVSLDALMLRRQALIEAVHATRAAYERMQDLRAALFDPAASVRDGRQLDYDLCLEWHRSRRGLDDERSIEDALKRIDAACWAFVLDRSGLRTLMDATKRAAWSEQLDKLTMPEFTLANVRATFHGLYASREDIFEEGVVSVFRKLSWDYKTNNPVRFGKRAIFSYASERYQWRDKGGTLHVTLHGIRHDFADKIDDLVRAFCVLDKKPEPPHDRGAYAVSRRQEWMQGEDDAHERDVEIGGYLRFRGFKNGNAHVTFLRLDLVDELNRIIAKRCPGALPPRVA